MTIEKANKYMKQHSPNYNIESNKRGLFAVAYFNEGNKYYKVSMGIRSFSKNTLDNAIDYLKSKELE